MKHLLSASLCLALSLAITAQAWSDDGEHFPDAGFVYDFFASDYCDPVPADMGSEELAEMRQLIIDDDYPIVLADVTGFMAGDRFGISPFGYAAPGRGFATVTTVWGEHAEQGVIALCLAMIQMGNQAVEPGSSRLVGLRQIDQAVPGDVLAAGFVITLNATDRLSASGDPIYRLERIGEVVIDSGTFNLTSADEQLFEGGFDFEGSVILREQDQRLPLSIQATAAGENVIERVPSLSEQDEEDQGPAQSQPVEPDRDYSQLPVPTTTAQQRQRPALMHDAPGREAFYNLLQLDLPRQSETPIEGDVDNWNWLQDRQFSAALDQTLGYHLSAPALVHRLVDLRDQAGEEFAITWDPDRRQVEIRFEHFDPQGRYVGRSLSFSFDENHKMVSRGSGSMATSNPQDSYRHADNYAELFGQPSAPVVLEPAPIVRAVLQRDAPPREAFYRLLAIDLPRKAEAGSAAEAADWEAGQKAAFEAQVAERFPADMPPQAVAEQLMALRESVGEVFSLQWDPDRRSLMARYEYPGPDGFIASTMDFLFNESDEQVFFSVGSEWRRYAPRSFPAADDLGELPAR